MTSSRSLVLVTGGAGFIGSHTVDRLVAAGSRVVVLDDLRTGKRANLAGHGVAGKVTVCDGAGTEVLPTLEAHGPFDLVFIDADKVNYHHYGRWAVANLRPGGLILGDNAYLFGELLDGTDRGRAMREFHQLVAASCDSVCIPTPDGLVLGIKR